MSRSLGLVWSAVLAGLVGCFSLNAPKPDVADAGLPLGDKALTLAYWENLRAATLARSKGNDMREVARLVRGQVKVIRTQPQDGVDPDLVAAAEAMAGHQEKMLTAAETAGYNAVALRASPDLVQQYADAAAAAVAASNRLKGLRTKLSARYGVSFPPLDG